MVIIGLIKKVKDAREIAIIAREKEAISIAWNSLITDKITKGTEINHSNFENELNQNENNTAVNDSEEEEKCFLVYFKDTTHTYKVYDDGKIELSKTIYYSITYVLNGGINPQGQVTSFKGGETVTLLNATKNNAYFQGWYESNDFSTDRIINISNRNEDITLYAKWIDETPTDYFIWTTTETEATITGFSLTGLSAYNAGYLITIAIPSKYNNLEVTAIGEKAFNGKNKIKELLIPESVTEIGLTAFNDCTGLEELTIPITLNAGGGNHGKRFYNVNKINKITFTKGLNGIGYDYQDGNYGRTDTYNHTPWYFQEELQAG